MIKKMCALLLAFISAFTFFACVQETEDDGYFEVFHDLGFTRGFDLKGLKTTDGESTYLNYGGAVGEDETPVWTMAQWGSSLNLKDGSERRVGDIYQYWNNDKNVLYNLKTKVLTLECDAYGHYGDTPRGTNGTSSDWPHLLVSQNFASVDRIIEYEELKLTIEFSLDKMDNRMNREYWLANLNKYAAQLVFFITIQNKNTSSSDKNDYFWFGVPLFDSRWAEEPERFSKGSQMADQGNVDKAGTGKFIYGLSPESILPEIPQVGSTYRVEIDLLAQIVQAFEYIQGLRNSSGEQVYFVKSKIGDMALGGMNTGWEMPGTFDGSATYYEISLKAKYKEF